MFYCPSLQNAPRRIKDHAHARTGATPFLSPSDRESSHLIEDKENKKKKLPTCQKIPDSDSASLRSRHRVVLCTPILMNTRSGTRRGGLHGKQKKHYSEEAKGKKRNIVLTCRKLTTGHQNSLSQAYLLSHRILYSVLTTPNQLSPPMILIAYHQTF
ncbi:hypothetical protein B0T17DRAFT_523539 [Bombardia bombarda]|uniref:Uncharacterized protein n=1 Tax=Bombardia bombarda TaxID=252184 RepID=A0AA39X8I7_9PEZI|nr:hypothetical protein B0T17DRAFT_523539 [Bombardia bombarda]